LTPVKLAPAVWSEINAAIDRVFPDIGPGGKKVAYWILFALESGGMIFILWVGLPLYRRLAAGPGGYRPGAPLAFPVLVVSLAMQVSYWSKRSMRPPIRRGQNTVGGHMLLFLARLSFIFAAANLSLLLFRRAADTTVSPFGVLVLLFASFAQFCYVRELEALGRILEGGSTGDQARTVAG
jgi:hypothetical protein